MNTWQNRSLFIREKHILLSDGTLHKDYDRKGHKPQEAWRQNELTGDKS
jgi:hypothetical protein